MEEMHHHYWEELNQTVAYALHELLFLPACCLHFLTHGSEDRRNALKAAPPHVKETYTDAVDKPGIVRPGDTLVVPKHPHVCRNCSSDIMVRAHSVEAHKALEQGTHSFHNWMANDFDRMEVYEQTPHPSGFEQNLDGLKDGHLQRVEQYWFDHQLASPSCAPKNKPSCCASAADWERTKLEAQSRSD